MKIHLPASFSSASVPTKLRYSNHTQQVLRSLGTTSPAATTANSSTTTSETKEASSQWLSNTKARIGKCIMFGMTPEQTAHAASVLKLLGENWRHFVSGKFGYLISLPKVAGDRLDETKRKQGGRAGLYRRAVEWGEMDSMNHVNNVTYIRWAESARVNWTNIYGTHIDPANKSKWAELCTPKGDGLILKSILMNYKFPLTYGDSITVVHKLASLPDRSSSAFKLHVHIVSEKYQRIAATGSEDIVVYDYKLSKKTAIRDFMMDTFRKTWEEQLAEKARVEEEMQEIEGVVRLLEITTWDREGAKEDFGGGT